MNPLRITTLAGGLVGVGAFGIALLWETWGGGTPCLMCYMERWGFLIAGGVGFCTIACRADLSVQRLLGIMGFIFSAITVIFFRHMGTQYHWFKVPGLCRATKGLSAEDFAEQLLSPTPQVTCDHIEFTLFGQPPTFYFFLFSLFLVSVCFWGFFKQWHPKRRGSAMYRRYRL